MRESALFTYFLKDTYNITRLLLTESDRNGIFRPDYLPTLPAWLPFRHFADDADCFVFQLLIAFGTKNLDITQ